MRKDTVLEACSNDSAGVADGARVAKVAEEHGRSRRLHPGHRGGTAEQAQVSDAGTHGKSERAMVANKQGNQPIGTLWSDGRAGSWDRTRER